MGFYRNILTINHIFFYKLQEVGNHFYFSKGFLKYNSAKNELFLLISDNGVSNRAVYMSAHYFLYFSSLY